ncbi:MAG TPA: YkgJ family cysteine cluster protein [Pyrinomonadaceae bacterium]|nr:YkgJ family cysteine cluster protein [Pyrinomonadaceae bacterium]
MAKKITDEQPRVYFDCSKCPAFCCSVYERVQTSDRDITRLAKHFGVSFDTARRRYTKMYEGERVLRRVKDEIFEETCMFLNQETRGCGIYHARPAVCREYPDRVRCAYYDLLQFERRQQDDESVIPLVQITFRQVKKAEVSDEHGSEKIWEWKPEKR